MLEPVRRTTLISRMCILIPACLMCTCSFTPQKLHTVDGRMNMLLAITQGAMKTAWSLHVNIYVEQ